MNKKTIFFGYALLMSAPLNGVNRSIHRPPQVIPEIVTCWTGQTKTYQIRDSHLEEGPLFKTFDKPFFYEHLLPLGTITYRNEPTKTVEGSTLSALIETLLQELQQRKKRFKHFKILKDNDFNFRNFCGLLILKFKQYPFVLKLFIENPESFVHPFSKGFEPGCFFIMGGGIMRHLTGFTRIKNLENIKKIIDQDPYWSQIIDFPRKWYWLPKEPRWFDVVGKHIAGKSELKTTLPSVYAVIADEIKSSKKKTIFNQHHALRCMRFCQFTHYRIDPHIQNFRLENGTGKLVLIDTENFRALVGLKDRFTVDSYISWYTRLISKYITDKFFRNKATRLAAQLDTNWEEYTA